MTENAAPVGTPVPAPAQPTPGPNASVVNSATLIMGVSGSGKSSLLGTAAEYVWETYRKVSLLYSSDGGGFPTQVQALINLGIIRVWRMRTRSGMALTQETCQRAAMGWWPSKIDPRTGETAGDIRLVPPSTEYLHASCPAGHPVQTVPFASLLKDGPCPTCKVTVTMANRLVTKSVNRTKGFEKVGAVLYDGLSSMVSWGMADLAERAGRNELTGEKGSLGAVIGSGGMSFGQANRAHYGFMQKRAEDLVLASNSITGLVVPPVWTALTQEGSDEGGLRVRGPQLAGQAKTADAPQWFGDTLEAVVFVNAEKAKFRRLYLQQYVDNDGIRHLCVVRSYPGMLPEYLEDPDKEGVPSFVNFSLAKVYRLKEEARKATEAQYSERYPDAPGVESTEVEYGDPAAMAVAQPAPTGPVGPRGPVTGPTGPVTAPAPTVGPRTVSVPRPVAAPATPTPAVTQAAAPVPPTTPTPTPVAPAAARVAAPRAAAQVAPGPRPVPPTAAAPAPSAAVTGPVAPAPPPPTGPKRGPAPPPPGRPPGSVR